MKIGIRKSPHLDAVVQGILACGDELVGVDDTSLEYILCWGWPQAQQIQQDRPTWAKAHIICVDCHPFALALNDGSASRILQLDNFGALAKYPEVKGNIETPKSKHDPDGPTLIIGQVYTAIQAQQGLVDVWHTGGYDKWIREELKNKNVRFRKHPRVWAIENDGQKQSTLIEDLQGCSAVKTWNSTVGVGCQLLGYPNVTAHEAHGWAHMDLEHLQGLRANINVLRSGEYWSEYRKWLLTQTSLS